MDTSIYTVTSTATLDSDNYGVTQYKTQTLEFGEDHGRAAATYDALCAAFLVESFSNSKSKFTRVMLGQKFSDSGTVVVEEETFYPNK